METVFSNREITPLGEREIMQPFLWNPRSGGGVFILLSQECLFFRSACLLVFSTENYFIDCVYDISSSPMPLAGRTSCLTTFMKEPFVVGESHEKIFLYII